MKAINLKTEHLTDPLGLDAARPLLSWNCSDGITQTAYEITAQSSGRTVWDSGKVASSRMSAQFGVDTASRQRISWQVRLWDEADIPGPWSEASFEMGLAREDWKARWINPELTCDPQQHKPASYLRGQFELSALGDARMYITCHGLYEAWLNGKRVGDFVLAPGSCNYEKRLAYRRFTIETGIDYGEWCEPDVDSTSAMRTPQEKVATAYFAYSGRLLAEITGILGKQEDQQRFARLAENARKAFRFIATEDGTIRSDRQAEYVRAIAFDLLTREEKQNAADDLARLVAQCGDHLNTGFLSTPQLCPVLADYGHRDTAYRLLLQETMPGWLYEVRKGATTIWENWDGINEQGNAKASLNHYSYGAVCGWLFGGVCGIRLDCGKLVIAPQPSIWYRRFSRMVWSMRSKHLLMSPSTIQ